MCECTIRREILNVSNLHRHPISGISTFLDLAMMLNSNLHTTLNVVDISVDGDRIIETHSSFGARIWPIPAQTETSKPRLVALFPPMSNSRADTHPRSLWSRLLPHIDTRCPIQDAAGAPPSSAQPLQHTYKYQKPRATVARRCRTLQL